MTNYERIKQQSVEEMADYLIYIVENFSTLIRSDKCKRCEEIHCTQCMKQLLESEVSE